MSVETDTNSSVDGQRCYPRVPFADRMRAIGRMVPTPRSRESRIVSHLETNQRARRQARELLLQHGERFPVELLDTDSGSESVAVEELQPALNTEWDLLGNSDQYVPGDNETGEH